MFFKKNRQKPKYSTVDEIALLHTSSAEEYFAEKVMVGVGDDTYVYPVYVCDNINGSRGIAEPASDHSFSVYMKDNAWHVKFNDDHWNYLLPQMKLCYTEDGKLEWDIEAAYRFLSEIDAASFLLVRHLASGSYLPCSLVLDFDAEKTTFDIATGTLTLCNTDARELLRMLRNCGSDMSEVTLVSAYNAISSNWWNATYIGGAKSSPAETLYEYARPGVYNGFGSPRLAFVITLMMTHLEKWHEERLREGEDRSPFDCSQFAESREVHIQEGEDAGDERQRERVPYV